MKLRNALSIIVILFSMSNVRSQSRLTDKIVVTIDLHNDNNKKEIVPIIKGNILTPQYYENHDYQVIVICDIKKRSYIEEWGEGRWKITIPRKSSVEVELICFCINRGFTPPNSESSIYFTKQKINDKQIACGCDDQQKMHDCWKEPIETVLHGISAVGTVNGVGRDKCIKAIKNAVNKLVASTFGSDNRANTIYFNGDPDFTDLDFDCTFKEGDKITFGLGINDEAMLLVIDAANSDINVDITNDRTICYLTCNIKPKDQFGEDILKAYMKAQQIR